MPRLSAGSPHVRRQAFGVGLTLVLAMSLLSAPASKGENRLVLVGVSWNEGNGGTGESITSVTYGTTGMVFFARRDMVDVYSLVNPPTGVKTITVTWSGGNAKGAIGGALSLAGVDQTSPLGAGFTQQGTSTTPNVAVSLTTRNGLVFDTVGIREVASVGSLNPFYPDQIQHWKASAGSVPSLTLTQGAASTRLAVDGSVEMKWTISASKPWATVAAEVKALWLRLHVDAEGLEFTAARFGVNVMDYATIQDAIDDVDVPFGEGLVYLPPGSYSETSRPAFKPPIELPADRSMLLLGAGPTQTQLFAPPSSTMIAS